jgi:hypothetical protein
VLVEKEKKEILQYWTFKLLYSHGEEVGEFLG